MAVIDRVAATMRQRGAVLAIALALVAPAMADAQATPRASTRKQTPEVQAERARRELLQKLDSLRWEFEHQRMSDAERERLRRELTTAFRALDEATVQIHALEVEAARSARVWSNSPSVRVMMRSSRPRGYLGLSFDGPNTEDVRDDELYIRFYQYPMIALVEPSSPAERAGIRKGDTLLALNGTDVVTNEIALSKMLVPEDRITVRVRRDGDTKNLPVIVGRAPEYVVRRMMTPPAMVGPTPAPRAMRLPEPPTPAAAPAPGFVWVFNEGIGGAKLETVTEGLGRALGVSSGVLVVRATAGTPAHESGLRDGDVIVRAAGKSVGSVRDLRSLVAAADIDEGVKLVIMRERKQREVTLRW